MLPHQAMRLARPGAPFVPWTPAQLSPYGWSDNTSTMVPGAGGNDLVAWSNHGSGNSWATASGAAWQPQRVAADLNGLDSVGFNGTDERFWVAAYHAPSRAVMQAANFGFCFAIYHKINNDNLGRLLLGISNGTTGSTRFAVRIGDVGFGNKPGLGIRRLDADASIANLRAATALHGAYHAVLWYMNWSTGRAEIWIDGTLDAFDAALTVPGPTSNTESVRNLLLGAYPTNTNATGGVDFVDCRLNSIIWGNIEMTQTRIDKLFGYEMHRTGLQGLLPALHPYKASPPPL